MQDRKKSERRRDIGVLLFPHFSNLCLANAVEPFRAVNNLSGTERYRWHFLSLDGGPVTSSSGLRVQADAALSRHEGGAYLFVMPSYHFRAADTPACARALRAARGRFDRIAGMDTGSWLLAAAGLLSGRRATIHWDEQVALAERFPDVEVSGDRVVHDGDILSCGGASTTFELVLDLIEAEHGAMMRLEVAALFLHGDLAGHGDRPPAALRPGQVPDAAMALMRARIEDPLSIGEIARQLGLSRRMLEQRCMDRYGIGPQQLYLATRLREARRLAEQTGLSVAEIAARCGYADASAMSRAFRREFGVSPRQLRQRRDARDQGRATAADARTETR
ncbi:GlxA family transcriptional regulator [Pseudodonghicola flavimaris]|uniref:GlxA family transcriptional regulator n=1 Tax=Pseudodonghicola flavimaris TaxID=3050036 RepID=A0ABT7EXP8_9RHOB|nr:GlxA family transcriptional regulator [Pseudodonghicola flavimaris]MDK3017054.1 GlxA family transcriptional regulator [Pseudodonghicola flavimaris]